MTTVYHRSSGEIQDLDWQSFIAPVQTNRKANERNVQEGVSMPVNVSEIEPDEKIVEIEME